MPTRSQRSLFCLLFALTLGAASGAACNTFAELQATEDTSDATVASCEPSTCQGTCCALEVEALLVCVSLDRDEDHCGVCGVRCKADQVCLESQCLTLSWRTMAAGGAHTCAALEPTGQVYCWGDNQRGQVDPSGDASGYTAGQPLVTRDGTPLTAVALSAGIAHSCALNASNEVYCWGDDSKGQLSRDAVGAGPHRVNPELVRFKALSAGGAHTCAITVLDQLYCWGDNAYGQLGRGELTAPLADQVLPVTVATGPWLAVSAGPRHTCAIHAGDGAVHCWGDNAHGQLGRGVDVRETRVADLPGEMKFLAVGAEHSCAASDSELWCWGSSAQGQLGVLAAPDTAPVQVTLPGSVQALTASARTTCALLHASSELYCWGENLAGQLGTGSTAEFDPAPGLLLFQGGDGTVHQASLGLAHACALHSPRSMSCWGANTHGQLGIATVDTAQHTRPVPVVAPPSVRAQ